MVNKTKMQGLLLIKPKVYEDERGYFFESFNNKIFNENFKKIRFVQDNESESTRGVLRGFHFQKPPHDQAKLVRCIKGKVLDVVVDIRKSSKTYGNFEQPPLIKKKNIDVIAKIISKKLFKKNLNIFCQPSPFVAFIIKALPFLEKLRRLILRFF